jgi:hypothetical protein
MPEERSRHLDQSDPEDDFQPPDLGPLRALPERDDLADARGRPCQRDPNARWRKMWPRR